MKHLYPMQGWTLDICKIDAIGPLRVTFKPYHRFTDDDGISKPVFPNGQMKFAYLVNGVQHQFEEYESGTAPRSWLMAEADAVTARFELFEKEYRELLAAWTDWNTYVEEDI